MKTEYLNMGNIGEGDFTELTSLYQLSRQNSPLLRENDDNQQDEIIMYDEKKDFTNEHLERLNYMMNSIP